MKPKSLSTTNLMLSLGLLALALVGCAHKTIGMKTVDAKTGKPLADVKTEWREHRYQMFRPITHFAPTNLPPSDQAGFIKVRRLHRNWRSTFVFSCPGYSNLYGRYDGGTLNVGTNIVYYSSGMLKGDFRFGDAAEMATKSNGCYLIPMPKNR